MHKKFILTMALILVVSVATAQLLTYGPKLAISFCSLQPDGADYASDGSVTSYNVGFFLVKEFTGVYLHFEPTYSFGLGGKINSTFYGASTVSDLSTLSLPIMLGKKFSNFRVFLGLSPGTTLGMSGQLYQLSGGFYKETPNDTFVDYILGAGVDVSNFTFSLRYSNTLTRGLDYNSAYYKVSQISLNAGVKLNKN